MTGPQGLPGIRGPKGSIGDTGAVGAVGSIGQKGEPGLLKFETYNHKPFKTLFNFELNVIKEKEAYQE